MSNPKTPKLGPVTATDISDREDVKITDADIRFTFERPTHRASGHLCVVVPGTRRRVTGGVVVDVRCVGTATTADYCTTNVDHVIELSEDERSQVAEIINARAVCSCPPMWSLEFTGRHHPKCPRRNGGVL